MLSRIFRGLFRLMVGPFSDAKPLLKWLVFTQTVMTIAVIIEAIVIWVR